MKWVLVTITVVACLITSQSFIKSPVEETATLFSKLSEYRMYDGALEELMPSKQFFVYELSSTLFSDYAEKQRLIYIPPGSTLKAVDDGLPVFPEGTILVKTFYYNNDGRVPSKGRKIIETRVLVKTGSTWVAGTYVWNAEQTEAFLATNSSNVEMTWVDGSGERKKISYHIPSNKECATCHRSGDAITPIGPKIRNLNREVERENKNINQLAWLQHLSILETGQPASFSALPDWQDKSQTLEHRARAYLDINCAHCHSKDGYCAKSGFKAGYDIAFNTTNIEDSKKELLDL